MINKSDYKDTLDGVIEGLRETNPGARLTAAWRVTRYKGAVPPEVAVELIASLDREGDYPFGMIMEALGHTGDRRAFRVLAGYLASPDPYHRALAAQALGSFGDRDAVALLKVLADDGAHAWKEDHGPDRTVGEIARSSIDRLG